MNRIRWRGSALGALAALALAVPFVGSAPTASAAEPGPSFTFVDCQADSTGKGTVENPLTSLDEVNALSLSAGDHVYFKRGTTCEGSLQPSGSGEAGAPIVIDAYGDASEPKPHIQGGGVEEAVLLKNVEYWEVRNLQISNVDADADEQYQHERRGIVIALEDFGRGDYYRLVGLDIHDVYGEGKKDLGGSGGIQLEVYANADNSKRVKSWFNDVVIEDNTIENVNRSGINMSTAWICRPDNGWVACPSGERSNLPWTPNTGLVIRGNTVSNVGGDGIVVQMSKDTLVEHNTVSDVANMPNGSNAGVWAWNADGTVFQYNEVFDVKRLPDNNDGTAFDADYGTTETVFQYNYSHDNEGGMMLYCGCGGLSTKVTFRYNVSENDQSRMSFVAGGTENAFYNNTIIAPDASGFMLNNANANGTSMLMANNLFVATADVADQSQDSGANAILWRNNAFSGPGEGWPSDDDSVRIAEALATTDAEGMKRFAISDDRLAGAGVPIAEPGTKDLFGTTVPSTCAPDIGAYQFSATDDDCGVTGASIAGGEARADATAAPLGTYRVTSGSGTVAVQNPAGYTTQPSENGTTVFTAAMDAESVTLLCTSDEDCTDVTMARVQNIAVDPSFDSTSNTPWGAWGLTRTEDNAVSGATAAQINGSGSAEQRVKVLPNTDYTLSAWVATTDGNAVRLGFKNFEGNQDPGNPDQIEEYEDVDAESMTHTSLRFNSGDSEIVSIYCYRPGGSGIGYCDDVTLTSDETVTRADLQPTDTSARVGQNATFTASFVGIDRGNISWQANSGDGWKTVEGAVGPALTVDATADSDGAQYRAAVVGPDGFVTSDPATLTVLPALSGASVTQQPEDASGEAGSEVTFTASAEANPSPSVQWQSSADGTSWSDVDGATEPTLTLAEVGVDSDGTAYRAAFSNPFGTVYSDAATLHVSAGDGTGTTPGDDTDESGGEDSSEGPASGAGASDSDASDSDASDSDASGELPFTGGTVPLGILALALVLMAAGAYATRVAKKRRAVTESSES